MRRVSFLLVFLLLAAPTAYAVQPDEILSDPVLEQRARSISSGLRCLVCQNQSIDDSDAPVARDLRILIREQLQQDKSDAEVVEFLVARYGEYVLLKPSFSGKNLLLWLAPFLILLAALAFGLRRQPPADSPGLSDAEKAEIAALLRKHGPDATKPPQI
jgi:cytochrome c-type biogenesis protein CcmH